MVELSSQADLEPLTCKICGFALVKVTTQETGWQQLVCPNVGKQNSLGHDIIPIGYLRPIENQQETGRTTNHATALNIFMRSNDWLKDKLSDSPNAKCGCGSCSLCAYRYFESLAAVKEPANQGEI